MIKKEEFSMFFRRNMVVFTLVSLGLGGLSFFLTIIFPATNLQNAELISSSWPQIMKDLFGDPIYAFTNIYGWIYLEIFHITFWLFLGVFASILASRIIAYEVENKTIDILLSTPITRTQLITSRFVSLSIMLLISTILTIMGCCIGIIVLGYVLNWGSLLLSSVAGFLLSLSIASITLLISIFIPRQIISIFVSCSLIGMMFLYTESLAKIIPFLEKISFVSLFNFYSAGKLLIHNSFSITDMVVLFAVTIIFVLASINIFSKKDIFA